MEKLKSDNGFTKNLKNMINFLGILSTNISNFCHEKIKQLQELIRVKNIEIVELYNPIAECGSCEELEKLGLKLEQPSPIKRNRLVTHEIKKKNWQKNRFYEKL